ncbi:hypothetical protein BCV70DRAFT_201336 [Testicularia cyperi]|uniref:Uncharacterized protein n=1 Tax=Testicularia cyperi TaxID=1882483 RepID=A0A317XNZ1_9BASI|nr:hypothetical protein BCV70DRAFT_201336 [Testicularia cyperi]
MVASGQLNRQCEGLRRQDNAMSRFQSQRSWTSESEENDRRDKERQREGEDKETRKAAVSRVLWDEQSKHGSDRNDFLA